MECRYCLSEEADDNLNELINPCNCQGSLQFVHQQCLIQWITKSGKDSEFVHVKNINSIDTAKTSNESYNNLTLPESCIPIYSINCEICKQGMMCYHIYQSSFSISLINTVKLSLLNYKNLPYFIFHIYILYFLLTQFHILIYCSYQIIFKPLKTKILMKLVNDFAFFIAFYWFTGDIFKFYKDIYSEQRGTLIKFLPRTNAKVNSAKYLS